MQECFLCKRNMRKSRYLFGSGCINNVYNFLELEKPKYSKDKEKFLYKSIINRTQNTGINSNQKIWLTDRYLTYQYLNKLHYGDYEIVKREIKEDINNIKRVEAFERLVTARKIQLKEAYDLYKKERKFETSLENLKENKDNKDEDARIKLLVTSFNYIFNMYRNRNQYGQNIAKAMAYSFWQTVIEVGWEYANFDIAADFLQHSLEENPENILITEGKVVDKINGDENFKKKIKEIVKKYGKSKKEFQIPDGIESIVFKDSDLYFAIHRARMVIDAKKKTKNKWDLEITLIDPYDFTEFKDINKYFKDTQSVPKSVFSSTIYNLAHFSVMFGIMKEYETQIKISLKDYEVK